MKPLVLLAALAAVTVTPAPVHLQPQSIVGNWVSLQQCSKSLRKFTFDWKYRGYCFDMLDGGRWSLRSGNKLVITHYDDITKETVSAKSRRETITIIGFEPRADRTFMYVQFENGTRDKWMK
jgi:hypothetical protein